MSGIIGGAGSKSGIIGTTELDYEEGLWQPSNAAGGTSTLQIGGGGTVVLAAAYDLFGYTKIGPMVHVSGRIECDGSGSVTGTMTGSVKMYGLPFTSEKVTGSDGGGGYFVGANPNVYAVDAMASSALNYQITDGNTFIWFYETTTTGHANWAEKINTTTAIAFAIWYRAALTA